MGRVVILDTRTKWHVDIPDDVPKGETTSYAWNRVLRLASKLSAAKNATVSIQIIVPPQMRHILSTPNEKS